jgi:hypothetical protein
MVGRLEGRSLRAPSGKRDLRSRFVVSWDRREFERREEKSRDLITGRAQEHLVNIGVCHI